MRTSRFYKKEKQPNICWFIVIALILILLGVGIWYVVCLDENCKVCKDGAELASFNMSDGGSNDPQPVDRSEGVVDIDWSHFTDYPRGNQDNAGAVYKDQLFSTGGFCGGEGFPYYCEG